MTGKQRFLKLLYPLIRKVSGAKNDESGIALNTRGGRSMVPFHALHATLGNKTDFDFASLKGKKVLLVNLASNCGFTAQYEELEALAQQYKSRLVILGFPANDFKGQEPGSDEEIESFCRVNYGVTFPIFTKASVVKPDQQKVFDWLTSKDKNGWNDLQPSWNFCKYLVDEKGELLARFKSHISPLDPKVVSMVEQPGES